MRDKVLGYGWPFRPEWSSNSTRKPRFFDWTADPKQATVDVAVYIGGAIQNGIDAPGRKIGWILESPEIARWQNTTPFIEQNLERVVSSYEVVLASDREFCRLHPNIVYHPAGSNLPWVPESRYGIYRKTRMCSMFASTKKMVEAHRYRQRVAERLRHKLDLYGGACGSPRIGGNGPSPDKSDGLIPYRFQVVIENASADLYYTEKITDCFATGTVPIYWGAPTIDELFDSDGIIRFDDDFDPDALGEDLYYSMMPAIRENFRRVRELEGADDLLYRRFIRGEDAGPWKSGAASGHGPNRCNAVDAGVPWKAWEANRILAMTRSVPGSEKEHLRVVTETERKTIASVAEIPPELVTVRHVASTMAPLQSAGSAGAIAMEQLNKAFLLHLPDAFIGDNVVFDRERHYTFGRWWLGRSWRDYVGTREVRHVDAAVSIGAWGGEAFQHFVVDAMPALAAVLDLLETPEMAHVRIVTHDEPGRAAQWFWKRLGIADRIVAKPSNAQAGFVVHADLVLFPQFEPNVNQLGFYPRGTLRPVQRRLGTLEPSTRDLVLYLQRRERRAVVDEEPLLAAVKEALAGTGLGLHVLCDASDPGDAEELVRRARIVLGPHGGAFANLVFAQPGTKVIEFVPRRELVSGPRSERLSMYYGLAQAASLDYWFVEPTRFDYGEAGILVDAEEVAQLVRRLASDGSGV